MNKSNRNTSQSIIETHSHTTANIRSVKMQCGTIIQLKDLEDAGISYIPCTYDQPLLSFANLWDKEKQITLKSFGTKNAWTFAKMQGVQIFTGRPTHYKSDGKTFYLIDIDIEKHLLDKYTTHFEKILAVYRNTCDRTPTEIQTKSGGRRLSAFCNTLGAKVFYKDKQAHKDDDKPMLLEFFSRCGLSRIDDRYSMLSGTLLDIPLIPKSALLQIRAIIQEIGNENQTNFKTNTAKYVDLDDFNVRDLDYDDKGKSPYLPARYCQITQHKDADRATVRYVDFGKIGQCFNCGECWRTTRDTPQTRYTGQSRAYIARQLNRYFGRWR
ncbi:MAG: hypothetical protein OXU23_05075 [Candidatus Poribacteria bacterium]|nr:hypothetical protein [Candidatus Poribacteria bacterium]